MKAHKEKEKIVDVTLFYLYLVATNPVLIRPINKAWEKFPALYEEGFLKSKFRKDPMMNRMTLESTLALRKVIGYIEVEGFSKVVELTLAKHPFARLLKPNDTDKEYFDRVEKKLRTNRDTLETVMIYSWTHPGWTTSHQIHPRIEPYVDMITEQVIGYKKTPTSHKMMYSVAESIVNYAFPAEIMRYGELFHVRYTYHFLTEAINQSGVFLMDFQKDHPTRKELLDAVYAGLESQKDELDDDFEDIRRTESVPFTSPVMHKVMARTMEWMVIEHLCKMLYKTRQLALEEYDRRNQEEIRKNKEKIDIVAQLKAEEQRKQEKYNQLQLSHDKLKLKADALQERVNALQKQLKEIEHQPLITVLAEETKEQIKYEDGTILVGGQPKWQKQFSQKHPNVKIMDGFNHNINADVFNEKVPLVIFNVSGMAHTVFYHIQPILKKKRIPIQYING